MSTFVGVTARELAPRKDIYLLAGVLLALFGVGTAFDLAISENLFDPDSSFGIFFAAFGGVPTFIAWAASGSLLISARETNRMGMKALLIFTGSLLILLAIAAMAVLPSGYIDWPIWLLATISLATVGITVFISLRVSAGVERVLILRVAAVLFIVVFAQLVIITLVKILWERPRMRMLAVNPEAHFQPWWSPGYAQKSALMSAGVPSEEFKSFPSGHAANGACALLLTTLAAFKRKLQGRVSLLFWIGATWALVVALSRIIMGAHFLTDTVAGLSVTFVAIIVTYQVAFPSWKGRHAAP